MWRGNDLLGPRYEKSYLELSRTITDADCPPVHAVTSLFVDGLRDGRPIELASNVFIALKLPQLNRVHLMIRDECRRDEQTRQRLQNSKLFHIKRGMTANFPSRLCSSSSPLPRWCTALPPPISIQSSKDQNYPLPDITIDGTDLLSSHLQDFSQRLEFLHLAGSCVISPEPFWSLSPDENLPNLPFWPHLIDVFVEYVEVPLSGQWLFERDPREISDSHSEEELSDEEDHYSKHVRVPIEERKLRLFRLMIIASHADRFYTAAAGRPVERIQTGHDTRWSTKCEQGRRSSPGGMAILGTTLTKEIF